MHSVDQRRWVHGIARRSAVVASALFASALFLVLLAPAGVEAAPYPPIPSTPAVATVAPPEVRVDPPAAGEQRNGTIQFSILPAGGYPVQAATGAPRVAEAPSASASVITVIAVAASAVVLFACGRRRFRACS